MSWMTTLTVLVSITAISLLVWLIAVIFQEGPKPQDFTIIDNFMPQYTNGFSQGILLDVEFGEERNGYRFVPKDIDYYGRKRQKNTAKVEPQLIYVDKMKVIPFPRGTFSGERNRIWLLPPNPEDLPEEVKRGPFGQVAMKMIDELNEQKTEVDIIREGSDRIKKIYERMGNGEISQAELDRLDSAHDALIKNMKKDDDTKTKSLGSPGINP